MPFIPDRTIEIHRCDGLLETPEVAVHLGIVTSLWSEMEAMLAESFGVLAGQDAIIATKLFTTIENEGSRKAVFMALANEKLKNEKDLLAELVAIFKIVKEKGSNRNTVAHGVWGSSPQHKDAIFCTNIQEWLVWQSAVTESSLMEDVWQLMEIERRWPSAIGYRESDFKNMEDPIRELTERIRKFRKTLKARLHPGR